MAEGRAESGVAPAGLRVLVLGQGERAEAHRAWYRHAGVDLVGAGAAEAGEIPAALLYDLCAEPAERQRALAVLLRRRHAAVLLAGRVAATAAAAGHLVAAARRCRCCLAVTGGTRFVPAWARLRELVCGGILGAVREVRVQISAAPALAAEALSAGMDLGLWLAGDAPPLAEGATAGYVSFRSGLAQITVETPQATAPGRPAWHVTLVADLGQAAARAVFDLGLPGRRCQDQAVVVTLAGGRTRVLDVPTADPAGSELAAVLCRQGAGRPWLALCPAERAARLLAVYEEGAGKVSAAPAKAG